MQDPIFITGCARSGTSLVAGCFHICGAFGGDMSGPNKNNQKGMFENYYIRNSVVKPLFRKLGVDPKGQYPLPDINDLSIPVDWRERIESVMQEQGYKEGPWFYKGAKACLTWPVWHFAFPNAKWIIVRRRTPDIINSCMKTSFMRAFVNQDNQKAVGAASEWDGWLWWVHQHEQRFIEMIQAGLNAKVVWPERMVTGDYQQIFEAIEWAGLDWSDEVYDFISPRLWKSRRKM